MGGGWRCRGGISTHRASRKSGPARPAAVFDFEEKMEKAAGLKPGHHKGYEGRTLQRQGGRGAEADQGWSELRPLRWATILRAFS